MRERASGLARRFGSTSSSHARGFPENPAPADRRAAGPYWHQPTFNVSEGGPSSAEGQAADAWWQLLYQHGADVVLNGHDHVYARFDPLNPAGQPDPKKGIREFIVGTGGESLDTLTPTTSTPDPVAATDQFYGVLKLTLNHNSYSWDFESALENPKAPAGTPSSYSDTGSANCHGPAAHKWQQRRQQPMTSN